MWVGKLEYECEREREREGGCCASSGGPQGCGGTCSTVRLPLQFLKH